MHASATTPVTHSRRLLIACSKMILGLAALLAVTCPHAAQAQLAPGTIGTPLIPIDLTDFQPLEYFDADYQGNPETDNGNGVINAYLMAQLSDMVYADSLGVDPEWEDEFRAETIAMGARDADFYANDQTGAEVAVVETYDALIIVHRGSNPNGTPLNLALADWIHDLNDNVLRKTIGNTTMYVHAGFWQTQNSVHWWVYQKALQAFMNNKRIWVTGHSLGGANATITAARLHYEEGIPVQGLHTFGSPKVGDVDLQKLFTYAGADGGTLASRTHRWAVEGDKVTTLFLKDTIAKQYYRYGVPYYRFFDIYYQHVGQTNHIYQTPNGYGYDYEVDYDSPDRSNIMFAPTWSLLPGGAHGMYGPALEAELMRKLIEVDRGDDWADIMDG